MMNQLCKVCGEPAAGFHFGAFTCEGCKSFFGRTYNNVSGIAECKNGGRCEINKKNRTSCKSCRLRKCLQVGMSKSGSRYGRRSNWFKIHCLLQAQGQQNGMSSSGSGGGGETNNNNSSVSNNNSPTYSSSSSLSKSLLPSTMTRSSFSPQSQDQDHYHSREIKQEIKHERRTPSSSSSASRNHNGGGGGVNGFQSTFPNLSRLSPESLSSLNRKLNSSDLADYFRAAGIGSSLLGGGQGGGGERSGSGERKEGRSGKSFNYSEDERGDDAGSRGGRSPGSLESPRSEASVEEGKVNMFTMPPGSPLMDLKPNDLSSFDLITRDLMKMGYDPLRLWPAMIGAQPNLRSFNPYGFMFPNFPGAAAAAAAFPGGFPGQPHPGGIPGGVPPLLVNGAIHPAKLFSAASLAGAESPLSFSAANLSSSSTTQHGRHSPREGIMRGSPPSSNNSNNHNNNGPIRTRVTPIVPPSPSLTLTPPISHHGSDNDPSSGTTAFPIALNKLMSRAGPGGILLPLQEKPIDLSAKSTNNNHIETDVFMRGKRKYSRINMSDMEDNDDGDDDESDREDSVNLIVNNNRDSSDVEMKYETKSSEYGDEEEDSEDNIKDEDDDEVEDLSRSNNNNNVSSLNSLKKPNNNRGSSRRSSCSSRSPSTERVGTPLDLTGGRSSSGTSNNPSPPAIPKIAT